MLLYEIGSVLRGVDEHVVPVDLVRELEGVEGVQGLGGLAFPVLQGRKAPEVDQVLHPKNPVGEGAGHKARPAVKGQPPAAQGVDLRVQVLPFGVHLRQNALGVFVLQQGQAGGAVPPAPALHGQVVQQHEGGRRVPQHHGIARPVAVSHQVPAHLHP